MAYLNQLGCCTIAIPFAGKLGDKLFRQDPKKALWLMGLLVALYGVFVTIGFVLQTLFYSWCSTPRNACQGAAFTQMGPTISAVFPTA